MGGEKVVVGMSGGVDSSVAAYILKQQGYDVIGVTMQIWQEESQPVREINGGCCGLSAVEDARQVAFALDIPYYVLNFRQVFQEKVIDYFISEYRQGRTPNPCIACNRYVKWEAMYRKAMELGARYIATGHYATVTVHPQTGRYTLRCSNLDGKDQSYALYSLTQEQLAHTLMPAGAYAKAEIREIARKLGFCVADKPDSQEICFVPDKDYARFIREHSPGLPPPGDFVDVNGNVLGPHKGIIAYTVGQRKGLGSFGKPMFVKAIDAERNHVILAEDADLYAKELLAANISYMGMADCTQPTRALAKIRYAHTKAPCTLIPAQDGIRIVFEQAQRAPTPGQAVVFYDDKDYVLGGGTCYSKST